MCHRSAALQALFVACAGLGAGLLAALSQLHPLRALLIDVEQLAHAGVAPFQTLRLESLISSWLERPRVADTEQRTNGSVLMTALANMSTLRSLSIDKIRCLMHDEAIAALSASSNLTELRFASHIAMRMLFPMTRCAISAPCQRCKYSRFVSEQSSRSHHRSRHSS
jgi:hypothetical protein